MFGLEKPTKGREKGHEEHRRHRLSNEFPLGKVHRNKLRWSPVAPRLAEFDILCQAEMLMSMHAAQ